VVEDLPVKKALFAELEQVVQPDAIFATNTSTFPVVELAVQTERPGPASAGSTSSTPPVMRLVEIVRPLTASDDTVDRPAGLRAELRQGARRGGRPGRLRRQRPALPLPQQPVRMLEHGTASDGGHRRRHAGRLHFLMGPFAARPGRARHLALDPRRCTPSSATRTTPRCRRVRRMVAAGHLGRKSGQGFYRYG
jgi:3-hydroxybutyryl-CoA dehydrogenase